MMELVRRSSFMSNRRSRPMTCTRVATAWLLASATGCAPRATDVVLDTAGGGTASDTGDDPDEADDLGNSDSDDGSDTDDEGADGSTGEPAECEEWTQLIGGQGDQRSKGVAIVDGQVVVSGWERRGPSDVPDSEDMFVAGFDRGGAMQWMQQAAEMSDERALALAPGPDDTFFVAGPREVLNPGNPVAHLGSFLTRHGLDGEVLDGISFPSTPPFGHPIEVRSVAADPSGNVYAVGWSAGPVEGVEVGSGDAFLFRYGLSGEVDFVEVIGSPESDSASAVAIAPNGDVIVAGTTSGDLGGGGPIGGNDFWVARYEPDGSRVWLRTMGTTANDQVEAIAVGADGSIHLAAVTGGSWPGEVDGPADDLLVLRLDADGEEQSALQYSGDNEIVIPSAIGLDSVGNLYVLSWVLEPDGNQRDLELIEVDPAGEIAWVRQLGTDDDDDAGGLAVAGEEDVYVSMSFSGALDGTDPDGYDTALIRLCGP